MIRTELIYNISSIDGVEYFGPAFDLSFSENQFLEWQQFLLSDVRIARDDKQDWIITVTVRYTQSDIVQPDRYFCICSACFHVSDSEKLLVDLLHDIYIMDWIVQPEILEWNNMP